jgi:hypothetical protein
MAKTDAPGPMIERFLSRTSSAPARVIVPVTSGAKAMVSPLLAFPMAWRSEPAGGVAISSWVLVTVMVSACRAELSKRRDADRWRRSEGVFRIVKVVFWEVRGGDAATRDGLVSLLVEVGSGLRWMSRCRSQPPSLVRCLDAGRRFHGTFGGGLLCRETSRGRGRFVVGG